MHKLLAAFQPLLRSFKSAPQRRKCGARRIQAAAPAAESGRIREAIRILQGRCGAFPSTMFHKTSPQYLTACDQTVVGVRQGESGGKVKVSSQRLQLPRWYLIQS